MALTLQLKHVDHLKGKGEHFVKVTFRGKSLVRLTSFESFGIIRIFDMCVLM